MEKNKITSEANELKSIIIEDQMRWFWVFPMSCTDHMLSSLMLVCLWCANVVRIMWLGRHFFVLKAGLKTDRKEMRENLVSANVNELRENVRENVNDLKESFNQTLSAASANMNIIQNEMRENVNELHVVAACERRHSTVFLHFIRIRGFTLFVLKYFLGQ